ncbi:MAG: hypothetical protein KGL34_00985 [Gammaproteobacteria bacterium]|nr:hypothetical protein [Gammaproteobacteria bacterium]
MKKTYFSLRRRAIVTPLWLATLALLAVVGFSTWVWNTARSRIVVVVPSAAAQTGGSAPLDSAGLLRAARLALLFGDGAKRTGIDAIFVEDSPRSRATAAPLAERLGLAIRVVGAGDPAALARRALRSPGGERVLIVADGASLPAVVAAVAGRRPPSRDEGGDRGVFYVIGVPRIGRTNVLRLRY